MQTDARTIQALNKLAMVHRHCTSATQQCHTIDTIPAILSGKPGAGVTDVT